MNGLCSLRLQSPFIIHISSVLAVALSIFQACWQLRSSRLKQEFACRVVCFVVREGEVSVLNGVAVDAAMWAGIIFANIPGRETAALQTVAFERDCMLKCL